MGYFMIFLAAAAIMATIVRQCFKQYKSRREKVEWRWEWEK